MTVTHFSEIPYLLRTAMKLDMALIQVSLPNEHGSVSLGISTDYAKTAPLAMAKLIATDESCAVTRKCVQFMGGYGYSSEYPVERKMRDTKMTELLAEHPANRKT